jgi:hypothetical protein
MISTKFSITEKTGLAFPIGMVMETIAMLVLDQIGIGFSPTSLLSVQFLILLTVAIPTVFIRKKELINSLFISAKNSLTGINMVWLIFIGLIFYIECINFQKCIYMPPYDNDSLSSFETIGFVSAMEHTYKGISLFDKDYITGIHGPASVITYAPFIQLSYAYVYTLGAETSKIIPAMMYLSFLIAFYGVVQRSTSKTAAAIATFFVLITPEMMLFSSHSMTNVVHAAFASTSIIYSFLYIKLYEKKYLYQAGVLSGANIWCRTEGIVFVIAAFAALLIFSVIRKEYKSAFFFIIIASAPAIGWFIFMKLNNMYAEGIVITQLFWDAEKIKAILHGIGALFVNRTYYGWTFYAFLIMLVANIRHIFMKKERAIFPLIVLCALSCYVLFLYHVDYKWDSMQNVLLYSAKRFLFCFVPLAWYYIFTNDVAVFLFLKLDNLLSLQKNN